jgi:hypothetical protein
MHPSIMLRDEMRGFHNQAVVKNNNFRGGKRKE